MYGQIGYSRSRDGPLAYSDFHAAHPLVRLAAAHSLSQITLIPPIKDDAIDASSPANPSATVTGGVEPRQHARHGQSRPRCGRRWSTRATGCPPRRIGRVGAVATAAESSRNLDAQRRLRSVPAIVDWFGESDASYLFARGP